MNDILIRGVEMPKSCDDCFLADCYWACNSKSKHCHLVPVPEHGDLIDQDEYRDEFMNRVYELCADDHDNYRANAIIDCFDSAPTVIPASEEVYARYTDTAGNTHWTGTRTGEHIIPASKEGE